jgi:hypothetical protein
MVFAIHEAGCGKKATRIHFMDRKIYLIIIMDVISINFKKLGLLLIASTSMLYNI